MRRIEERLVMEAEVRHGMDRTKVDLPVEIVGPSDRDDDSAPVQIHIDLTCLDEMGIDYPEELYVNLGDFNAIAFYGGNVHRRLGL